MKFILKLYDCNSQTYKQESKDIFANISDAIRQGLLSGRLFEVEQLDNPMTERLTILINSQTTQNL